METLSKKLDKIIDNVTTKLEILKQNSTKEISEWGSIYLTIYLWSEIDNLLEDDSTYEYLFKNSKYSIFNDYWLQLFHIFFQQKSNSWNLKISDDISKFLSKIIQQNDENILNNSNNLKLIRDFFFQLERNIHLSEPDYSYLFLKIFIFNSKNILFWNYSSQTAEINVLNSFNRLKTIRNEAIHKNQLDAAISNLVNWENIYWKTFKEIFEEIKKIDKQRKFIFNLQGYLKKMKKHY